MMMMHYYIIPLVMVTYQAKHTSHHYRCFHENFYTQQMQCVFVTISIQSLPLHLLRSLLWEHFVLFITIMMMVVVLVIVVSPTMMAERPKVQTDCHYYNCYCCYSC